MRKTTRTEANKITVDLRGLMSMLSVGRGAAELIARESGAALKIGGRRLYLVDKVKAYLDNQTAKKGPQE